MAPSGSCAFLLSLEVNSGRPDWAGDGEWLMAEAWLLRMSREIWAVWNRAGDGWIAQGRLLLLEGVRRSSSIYSTPRSELAQLPPPPLKSGWRATCLGEVAEGIPTELHVIRIWVTFSLWRNKISHSQLSDSDTEIDMLQERPWILRGLSLWVTVKPQ